MTRYIEPTLKARQRFFLAATIWAGCVLLSGRLDQLLPPLSADTAVAMDQALDRILLFAGLSTAFFSALSFCAIRYARRAVESRQWPPNGRSIPFRAKVRDIKNPRNVWLFLGMLLIIFALQIALSWGVYLKQRTLFDEWKEIARAAEHR